MVHVWNSLSSINVDTVYKTTMPIVTSKAYKVST